MPKFLTVEEQQTLQEQMYWASASPAEMTDDSWRLARELSQIHGEIRVAREVSGIHFYMASPACLEEDGTIELQKMHLALNVTKYLAGEPMAAMCMKSSTPYNVLDLLSMPTLEVRGYEFKPKVVDVTTIREEFLEYDEKGRLIPKSPGEVVPVYKLAKDHAAQQYLSSRGFNAFKLFLQFRLSFGLKERSDIHYRRMGGTFRATPQGRLIFYVDMEGANRGWQARILEYEDDKYRYYFHPYNSEWQQVLIRHTSRENWCPDSPIYQDWDAVKYVTSHGCIRNRCLLGFDAAVDFNRRHGFSHCFFMEGPLDAGRIGMPALATLGKFVSEPQIQIMSRYFQTLVHIPDTDDAGRDAARRTARIFQQLGLSDRLIIANLPEGAKDLGSMSEKDAVSFANSFLPK